MTKKFIFLFILFIISLFVQACENKKENTAKIEVSKKTENVVNTSTGNNKIVLEKQQRNNIHIKLNEFDLSVVDIALKNNDIKKCNLIDGNLKQQKCREIVNKELSLFNKLECDKLKYLKQNCYDKLYFQKRECEKIKDEGEKKSCIRKRNLEKALKKGDVSYCNTLPKIKQKECRELFKK